MLHQNCHRGIASEDELPGQEPARNAAECINVDTAIEVGIAERLLGCHERRRPVDGVRARERGFDVHGVVETLDESEVQDLDKIVVLAVPTEKDVRGLANLSSARRVRVP